MRKLPVKVLVVAVAVLAGCSAMPPRQSLGIDRHEQGWNKDNGRERLVAAFLLQELPEQSRALCYEVTLPEALKKSALVGVPKEFVKFDGTTVFLERKTFQGVLPDSNRLSVYVSGDTGYACADREIRLVTLFDPEGKPYVIRQLRHLTDSEKNVLYERIEWDFPEISSSIGGIGKCFHFGPEADQALLVPPTVTFGERGAGQGLGAIRLTPNVWGEALSKGFALYRTLSLSPTTNSLVMQEEKPVQSTNSEMFSASTIGNK